MANIESAGAARLRAGGPSNDAHEAAIGFEALLFEQALAPLVKPMGFFGEIAAGSVARAVAQHADGGLTARIESLLEAASK